MANIERKDIKRLKRPKIEIKPWVIYLWREGDKYLGASPVVTKDGIKEVFCAGWEVEKVPGVKRNEDRHQAFRAKTQLKNLLNDTLNVINWYGKEVLNDKGDIDPLKLQIKETHAAMQAIKNKVDIGDLYPIKKFPIKEITIKEAREYNFK